MGEGTGIPPSPDPYISPPLVVSVVGWLLVASFVVATATRLATKLSMKRLLGIDDYLIVFAMVSGIGQMEAVFVQTQLAKNETSAGEDLIAFQKALYSSQLLFIPTICIAKFSVLHSLYQITPIAEHKVPIFTCTGVVGFMLFAFEFATGFQCSVEPWAVLSGRCFDQTALWQAFGAFDMLTDTFIVAFPIYIVSTLQMGTNFKVVVAGVFAMRISAVAAAACRLVYLTRSSATPQLNAYDFWVFQLTTEVEQGLAIITACIPFLKPFFESLETGMLAPSHGLNTMAGSGVGSGYRSKKSELSNDSYKLKPRDKAQVINVSRTITTHSSHSEECGLIKEETQAWVVSPKETV